MWMILGASILMKIIYISLYIVGFVKQQTKGRGSHIVDELISIVQTLYSADVKFSSTSEKVAYLASFNASTVIDIKQYILQNWSSTTENAIEIVDDITKDGSDAYTTKFWLTVTWDLLFFIIIFVAIVGNLLVLWIVAGKSSCSIFCSNRLQQIRLIFILLRNVQKK